MKTTQAVRNIRKYKRKIETAPKGKMVTDDYGNKLSVKKKADGTWGRRHTLSQGVKRAQKLAASPNMTGYKDLQKRHTVSADRRRQIAMMPLSSNLHPTSLIILIPQS
ncbi:MAG: hypothetical protein IPO06_14015 [Leptospiraceae bacterium]|nr:hypothetical protein [Leptospiraceae bacterium]